MNAQRPPKLALWRRAIVAVALVAFPFAIAAVDRWRFAHDAVRFFVGYSPERFLHGAVWTLPLSALINTTASHVAVAVVASLLLLAPYLILAGYLRTFVRFFAGHFGCTMVILVALTTTSAAGWSTATKLYSATDMGVSAGLAAVGGAFVVLVWRTRARWLVGPAFALPLYFYTYRLGSESPSRVMADIEHLIAFGIGIAIEWRWPARKWPERVVAVSAVDE
jgi:hypothetical protein